MRYTGILAFDDLRTEVDRASLVGQFEYIKTKMFGPDADAVAPVVSGCVILIDAGDFGILYTL